MDPALISISPWFASFLSLVIVFTEKLMAVLVLGGGLD